MCCQCVLDISLDVILGNLGANSSSRMSVFECVVATVQLLTELPERKKLDFAGCELAVCLKSCLSVSIATTGVKLPKKIMPKLTGKKWSDGSWSIEGKGEYASGQPCFSIEYIVDKTNKTYTINPIAYHGLDDSYLELQASDSGVNPDVLRSDPNIVASTPSTSNIRCEIPTDAAVPAAASVGEIQPLYVPGAYVGYATVRTRDIPNWTITRTSDRVGWFVLSNGLVDWFSWRVEWHAVNPSPINTHWYINQQDHSGPTFNWTRTTVLKYVYGAYYNYDWLFTDLITTANQSVTIIGKNDGFYDYFWTHYDAGESSSLIWGVLTLNAW